MPIKTFNITSDYESIPDQEDVTPIDRSIAKKAKKSIKYVVCGITILAILVIILYFGLNYATGGDSDAKIYQSSLQESQSPGLRKLKLSDMTSAGATLKSFTFGNTKCEVTSTTSSFKSSKSTAPAGYQCSNLPLSAANLAVDTSRRYQEIVGFGGAFTEASAINFYSLPREVQKSVLELYFGETGISLTLGRVHINSCDFSPESYSFDDIEGDYDLQFFDFEVTHDNKKILPLIREAMSISKLPIKLLASPWSPPAWMKEAVDGEQSMTGSATPNGLQNDERTKLAWARYIAKFIDAYENKGAPIWAVTPQNEPEFPAPWEACAYNASFEHDFIRDYLGPVLKAAFPKLLLLGFDHNKDHLEHWTDTLMNGGAGKFLDGMAFHWYGGMERVTDGTYGYDAVNASHHLAPDKLLLATEGCSCPGVKLGDWLRAERLGHDVMYDLNNFAGGWIDWNLLLDHEGGPNHLGNMCDASLIVSKSKDSIVLQPKYFYFGHFSKFVLPGSVRVYSRIAGNFRFEKVDPNVQAGLEVGMFDCESSTRQMWSINSETQQLQLRIPALIDGGQMGHVDLCVTQGTLDRPVLKLADCSLIFPIDDDNSNDEEEEVKSSDGEDSTTAAEPVEGSSSNKASDALKLDDAESQAEAAREEAAVAAELSHGGSARRMQTATAVVASSNSGSVSRKIEVASTTTAVTVEKLSTAVPFLQVSFTDDGQLLDLNSGMCVGLRGDVREPGALLELQQCVDLHSSSSSNIDNNKGDGDHQHFRYSHRNGEVVAKAVDGGLCLTAGWPFLSAAAFRNDEKRETVVVVMNEAALPTSIALSDAGKTNPLGFAIFGRSIQTIVY